MGIMYKLMKHRNLSMDLNSTSHHFESPSNIKSERSRLITIEGNIIDAPVTQSLTMEEDNLNRNMDDTNVDKQFTAEHIIQLCKFLAEKSKRNKNLHKQQQSPKRLNKSKQTQFQFQQMECENDDNVVDSEDVDLYQNEALPLLTTTQRQHQQQQQQQHQLRQRKFDDENNDFKQHHQGEQQQTRIQGILSSRLSPDINSLNISTNTMASTCAMQHYQQQQQYQHQHQHQQQQQQLNEQHELFNYQQHQHEQTHEQQLEEPFHKQSNKRDILLKIRRQIFERKRLRENGAFEGQQMLNNAQVWRPW
ncbi:hypothetical protein DOY81_002782 [Sarcophaga bullata]|nr:hypothetical protein DOY81_002782 [Sarcophaga bullata]